MSSPGERVLCVACFVLQLAGLACSRVTETIEADA